MDKLALPGDNELTQLFQGNCLTRIRSIPANVPPPSLLLFLCADWGKGYGIDQVYHVSKFFLYFFGHDVWCVPFFQ